MQGIDLQEGELTHAPHANFFIVYKSNPAPDSAGKETPDCILEIRNISDVQKGGGDTERGSCNNGCCDARTTCVALDFDGSMLCTTRYIISSSKLALGACYGYLPVPVVRQANAATGRYVAMVLQYVQVRP